MALKIGTNFGNNYETAHSILSTRQLFNQEDWEYNAINGNLDAYIDAIYDTDASTLEKLNSEYNYEFADKKTRTWALFNEKYADKTVEQNDKYLRTRYKTDENGNYVVVDGQPQTETYYASDYDYYKEIIKEHNNENQLLYLQKLEQQAKDEIHPITQFFASLTAELGEVVSGTYSALETVPVGLNALVYATIDAIKGKDWAESYAAYIADDDNYIAGSKRLEQLLSEFERKYTYIRDIDGNFTPAGEFFVGLANSTGQMIPALITSVGIGAAGKALDLSAKTTQTIAQVSSSAVFYGSMTIDNIHDTYQYFKENGVSVSSAAIIGNSVLKSALQLIVELGLGKLTGHFSQLDSLVFGRSTGKLASDAKSLGKSLFDRVIRDFTQEGMEEVLQDTSDYLVDHIVFMFDQNFGELTDISVENLALSFIAGGIMSLSGHAVGIARHAISNASASIAAAHNIKVEQTGEGKLWDIGKSNQIVGINEKTGKVKKLNSVLAYEYSLDMQTFMNNMAEIFEMGKTAQLVNRDSKEFKAYESAVAEAYTAYRLISSIYRADPAGFAKANEILTQVQMMMNNGAFNAKLMADKAASLVGETMYGISVNRKALLGKLSEASISTQKGVYDKNTPITDSSLDKATIDAIDELLTNGNIDRVIVTEDGKHLVIADNIAFVQLKQLQNGGADSIYESMAEETLANALIDGEYHGVGIKEVTAVYREVSGRPDASEHEAALSLFLNDSFFRIMLSTANKDTYQLLTSLVEIEQKVVPDKQRTAKYKQKLNQVINNMHKALYEYLLYQSNADYNISILSQEEKNRIRQVRWCKNLYQRVISKTSYKKLTDADWKVLTNRINAMPADAETKKKLLTNLKSDNEFTRMQAMNEIAARYRNIFTSMYDGKTYMPDNSIPNRVFNTYLQQNGLTIETLRSENVSDDIKSTVIEAFGEFNQDNLLKFYQAKFGITCNNAFTFTINSKGIVSIYDTKSKIQVGFSEYKAAYESKDWMTTKHITDATNIERVGKRNDALGKLLHHNLSAATAAYITIDDVISNPTLLSDDVKKKIVNTYGTVDTETTFRYLQDYFITTTKNTTVIVLQDGTYAFGNVRPMQKLLRNSERIIKADDTITVKSLISERYLYGRLADISITKVTDKSSKRIQEMMTGSIASYDAVSNTIYLNAKLFTNTSQELIKFAILHEFQHAMQYENGMNLGLNVNWLLNEDIPVGTRKKLVEDIRRHCPEVFGEKSYNENKMIILGSKIEASIAQQFVYYCSGESTAYGVDAQKMLNFYPFVVSANSVGIETLKTPWGTEYSLDSGRPVSLVVRDTTDTLIEILSTDEYKDYFNIANEIKNRYESQQLRLFDEEQMNERQSLSNSIFSLQSITDYTNASIGTAQDVSFVKREVLSDITADVKEKMLRAMQLSLGLNDVSYSDFINMSIPVVRIQTNVLSKDQHTFSSFAAVDLTFVKTVNMLITLVNQFNYNNVILVVGTVKPKDIIGYIPNSLNETLIPESTANSFKRYKVSQDFNTTRDDSYALSNIFDITESFNLLQNIINIIQNENSDYMLPSFDDYEVFRINSAEMGIFSVLKISNTQFESMFDISYDDFKLFLDKLISASPAEKLKLLDASFGKYGEALKIYALNTLYYAYSFNDRMSFSEFLNSDVFVYTDDSFNSARGISSASIIDNTHSVNYLNELQLQEGANRINISAVSVKAIKAFDGLNVYVDEAELRNVDSFSIETRIEDGKLMSTTDYKHSTSLGEIDEDIVDRTKFKSMAESTNKKKKRKKDTEIDKPLTRQSKQTTGAKGLDRIYVSQAMGKDTALEKYGYTGKYKRTYMSKGTYDFMRRFSEDLLIKNESGYLNEEDERLLNAIKSGKVTSSDILDYFRDATEMSDKMFTLINDSFFKNTFITTFDELKKRVDESGQYYALRTIMRIAKTNADEASTELYDKFIENADEDLFIHAAQLLVRLKNEVKYKGKTVNINKLFEQISTRYNNNTVVYSERLLRRLWMQYFDGTAATGGYIAGVARWAAYAGVNITGEGTSRVNKSTNETVAGTDLSIEELTADTRDDFDELFNNMSVAQKIQQIQIMLSLQSGIDFENVDKMDSKKREKFMRWFHEIGIKLEEMSDKNVDKYYEKLHKKLTDSQRQAIMRMSLALEAGNVTYAQLKEKEAAKLQSMAIESEAKTVRPSSAIVANMRSLIRTIKNNVGQNIYKRILKDNSDIFDSKLNLKTDDMKEKVNNRMVYKSPEILEPILERIRSVVQDVKDGVYESSKAAQAKSRMQRELEKIKSENEKLKTRRAKGGKTRVVRYDISDDSIEIQTSKQIPTALKRILDNTFIKSAETKVKFLSEQEAKDKSEQQKARHIKMNLESFIKDNAENLLMLTQADVDEIVDFYLHSEVIPTTNKARQYVATRIYLLSYLLTNKLESGQRSINTVGIAEWTLSSEQRKTVTDYLQNVNVSIPAAMISAWKAAMSSFDPSRVILKSVADRVNIDFTNEEIDNLVDAVQSKDPERIKLAQHKMYSEGLKRYTQTTKQLTFDTFLNKVISFERMCMLSGPGTWIRNWTSNFMVQGGNWASGKVGSLIANVFPKKWKRDGQYNITNTKVDSTTRKFVTEQIVNSGLLSLLGDSLSKYDTRKSKRAAVSADESITELLKEAVRSRILYDNGYNNKILDMVNRGLGKMLSDNHWINKQTIYYLSRTLIEDKVDLNKGLSKSVIEHLADAYRMAAQDYMHKSNIFNAIESKIYEKLGTKGYFIYKQILPFASAGWNWFVEGLNYTPVGLIKSIIQYAKLENTITKLEDAEQRGHFDGTPSKFAQYKSIRNLGKGVLGTIGCIAGILLAACGVAGIDEEDEKYKLRVGDVYVDISGLFGTQGILMGITVTSAIANSIQKSKDGQYANVGDELWSIFKTTLDATFADSTLDDIVGTFRYSSSVGDWLSDVPFTLVGMMVPNFLKQLLSFAPTNSVQYSKGILGKLEKMVIQNLPVLAYAFPKQVDPYTGETQVPYIANSFIKMLNKFMPVDIAPYRFSDTEKEALSLGLKKGQLTGNYEINGQKIKLNSSEVYDANTYYGKLNKKDLEAFTKNKTSYKVWDEKKKKYVTLKYSQMTEKQKANVIDRIMSNNASLAKIYILTSTGRYKYFADTSEFAELRKAGIKKNIYKSTSNKLGFID